MESKGKPEFNIGDRVVVLHPEHCAWGWNKSMLRYVGKETTITQCSWSSSKGSYCYRVEVDNEDWMWDIHCLESANIPEFEIASADLLMSFLLS